MIEVLLEQCVFLLVHQMCWSKLRFSGGSGYAALRGRLGAIFLASKISFVRVCFVALCLSVPDVDEALRQSREFS